MAKGQRRPTRSVRSAARSDRPLTAPSLETAILVRVGVARLSRGPVPSTPTAEPPPPQSPSPLSLVRRHTAIIPLCAPCSSRTTRRLPTSSARGLREAGFAVDHGGRRRGRRSRGFVTPVRRRHRRPDAAQARRAVGHRRDAPARHRDARPDPERPAFGGRSRPRAAGRRRRLPDEAVRVRGAARARAGARAARDPRARADHADGRGSGARSAVAPRHARRQARSTCARASSRCSST